MKNYWFICFIGLLLSLHSEAFAQKMSDTLGQQAQLPDCIRYALDNQPAIRQSLIDQEIADRTVRSALAAWYPQIGAGYNVLHYLKLPVTLIPDAATGERRPVALGAKNTSTASFSLSQTLFSRDVLLASQTADAYRVQASQATTDTKIAVVVNVSKAFYDVILTQRQADVLAEDIVRLQRSLQDATNQYQSGVVDKTDPQRARIALNNTIAQRKQFQDQVGAKYQILKQLMGYPPTKLINLTYDTLQLVNDAALDTTLLVNPASRIEYQLLQTQGRLLEANVRYNRWSYLPTVSANANYNLLYQNNVFPQLYTQNFPNSLIGLSVAMPIFQGGRRIQQTKIAELQVKRLQWDLAGLTSSIDAEYAQALATYKGNLANYLALRENQLLAEDVYRVINLQYRSGVRSYLDVTIAEADLRTARLNVFNALNQVLVSKLDVQRSLGQIRF
ncbi:TolC family protein [Spirosoma utsteinense]|uniref:Outer membrane protein TolC n=1 Tax=Spirosoma utsteinense TaxID=2585773 RepID=A0ABR6W6M6_9BACT|nr:TolC family protein [Spirosoma utsteinense]MBC3788279.1 outer membrane protein TolC [Spirosoma utsteinense]MBC3792122.1 outer membrane protein TolC [Spirosoma utsteinense]